MNKVIDKILEISKEKERKDVFQMTLKCMEELGELSQAILSSSGAHGCAHKNKTIDDVKEEAIDVFIVATALLSKVGLTKEEIISITEKKIIKWQSVISRSNI
jgi:NTP pyrophosphatase (non-canonical NTP hydrolase)